MPFRFLKICPLIALSFALTLLAPPAQAKDLRGRVAAGVELSSSLFSPTVPVPPALSVKFTLPGAQKSINSQLQAYAGAQHLTLSGNDESLAVAGGARYLFTFVAEDNCNFFGGLGAGVAYHWASAGDTLDPFAEPIAGIEFFPFGLENLGLTAAALVHLGLASQGTAALFGAHYYF